MTGPASADGAGPAMIGESGDAMLFHALYIVAIVAEAMTAALAAGRRAMDWVGV